MKAGTCSSSIFILGSYAPSLVNFRGPLISALRARGHRVVAAAPALDTETAARLVSLGAEPVSLTLSNTSLNPVSMLRSVRELRRLIALHEPDVLISYTIKPVILGALAGKAEGVSRIVSMVTGVGYAFTAEGGSPARRLVRLAATHLYRAALARSDVVLFQNPDDEALFRRLGLLARNRQAGIVNGSGVDLRQFAVSPVPEKTSFLMIARLLRDKGIREFAEAARRIRAAHPEVPIALVGYLDPSPDSLSKRELDDLISDGITFHGKLADVRPAIAQCSVYVLPSYREGTPRSVLEAMAMGRAIVTTDAPGCRETVVDGRNGFLVPVRDAESLFKAMKHFIDQPQLAKSMGAESRKMAEKRYDATEVSAEVIRHAGL